MINALGLLLAVLDTLQQYAERGAGRVVPGDLPSVLPVLLSAINALVYGRGRGSPLTDDEQQEIRVGYDNIQREIDRADRGRDESSDNSALRTACECMSRMRDTVFAAQSRLNARDA